MKQQRPVETVEEFKLPIAAIIRAKPEQIPVAPRRQPMKRTTDRKTNVAGAASDWLQCTFTKSVPAKIIAASI